MKPAMWTKFFAGVLAVGSLFGMSASSAQAQGPVFGRGAYGGGYRGGHDGGGHGGVGYGGGGYGVPSYNYYGNGGHDAQPHWHTRQTPFGGFSYYGQGRHDFRPHGHTETPYGITSYNGGFFSNTQSYSPPTPYGYLPW